MESILLVEDKPELREMLEHALKRMHYNVTSSGNVSTATTFLRTQRFSAVLTDLKLPGGSGMDVLQTAIESDPAMPVIVMTAYGTVKDAVQAIQQGAYDFIQKPVDLDHLEHLLKRAIERQQLLRENIVLKEEYARRFGFPRIIGEHASMREIARQMQAIAPTNSTVLLLGDSGTGKELFARAIHQLSPRSARSFVALNCAAIPETLIENELFGHERGAFTGADSRQIGKFELAHGGTIFLDEIGELPLPVQAKLLRMLESGSVQRLGSTAESKVDVRIVAATNRDLEAAVKQQQFRQDLFYRLNVFSIHIPALRERGDDVQLLAEHFLELHRRELRKSKLSFSDAAREAIQRHPWPGNVRELQNAIERAAILGEGELLPTDLGLAAAAKAAAAQSTSDRAELESVMKECKWNKQAAAAKLGIPYRTLLARLRELDLN